MKKFFNMFKELMYKGIIVTILIYIVSFFFNVPVEYILQNMHYLTIVIIILLFVLLFCIIMLEKIYKNKEEEK